MNDYQAYKKQKLAEQQAGIDRITGEQKAAEQAAITAGVENAVTTLNNQKGAVTSSAEDSARQAYVEYMKAKNQFGDRANDMARVGNGGSGDYMATSALNGYQNANATILTQRDKLINDIDTAIVEARQKGDIGLANALATSLARELENMKWGYTAGTEIEREAYNNQLALKQQEENRAYQEKVFDYNANRDALNDALSNKQLNNEITADKMSQYNTYLQYYSQLYPSYSSSKLMQMAEAAVARASELYPVSGY